MKTFDIGKIKSVHFIGIKGVAMTALAVLCKEKGLKVSGSDIDEEFITDKILREKKIFWKNGFAEKNLPVRPDLVVVTGAHGGMTNSEAQAAKKEGLKVIMHAKALGMFMAEKETGIAVAGSHGKGTTASMIAFILQRAGFDPSYAIGVGEIFPLGPAGHFGRGKYFVAEADEYLTCPKTDPTPRFLYLNPKIIVITNIDFDHPDAFKDLSAVKLAFKKFKEKLPLDGFLVESEKLKIDEKIKLKIPGRHNLLNATAALKVGRYLGISESDCREILADFKGSKRRFEYLGEINGLKLYDDYAHHPKEIMATLKAAREYFGRKRKIICVFQPHTYSRTKALLFEFAKSFTDASKVIVADIFSSARETDTLGISSKILAEKIKRYQENVKYIGGKEEIKEYLKKNTEREDVIITMGAGDIYKINEELKNGKWEI